MAPTPLSAWLQSLPPLPTIKLVPSGADSQVGGWACAWSRPLGVSPTTFPVRLGVSLAATSTSTGVFNQRFEALFPCAGVLGCEVCFTPPPFLPVYLCVNVGPQGLIASSTLWGLLAAAWPAQFHNPPPRWVCQLLPCCGSSFEEFKTSHLFFSCWHSQIYFGINHISRWLNLPFCLSQHALSLLSERH